CQPAFRPALRFQQQRNEIMKKFFQLVKSASPAPHLTHPLPQGLRLSPGTSRNPSTRADRHQG
ncbi:hypothetical protein, partial [Bordetella pertussis]